MHKFVTDSLKKCVHFFDRIFDWFYSSRHNPLYRSGTLGIFLMTIATITGLYLLLIYKLGTPYEAMVSLQNDIYIGRWIRSLHRYTSDAAMVVIIFHFIRMLSEGKNWGPRLLAWITGVFLLVSMLIIGWTGFVLVWDLHAQELALAGANMLDQIPLFSGVILRTLSGATPVGSSFFFLNLFIHMSLPLLLIFGIWLHTSKLNEAKWFPAKKVMLYVFIIFFLASIFIPAPLAEQANLLSINNSYFLNIYYSFFIPLIKFVGPALALFIFIGGITILTLLPFIFKPAKGYEPQKSKHDQAACTGCKQCVEDCPFESITMVPRTIGQGSEFVANVNPASCVGCGICAGSCHKLAISPDSKAVRFQIQNVKELKTEKNKAGLLFIYCECNPASLRILKHANKDIQGFAAMKVTCTGILHAATISFAQQHFKGIFIMGCPPNACLNRTGQQLLEERLLKDRDPKPPGNYRSEDVRIFSGSRSEINEAESILYSFAQSYKLTNQVKTYNKTSHQIFLSVKSSVLSVILLGILIYGSAIPYSNTHESSYLRVAVRLPGKAVEICRDRSKDELAKMPAHMRKAKDCSRQAIPYLAVITIDNHILIEKKLEARGARSDKPIILEQNIEVTPGLHDVEVILTPLIQSDEKPIQLKFKEEFQKGKAILVSYNSNQKDLFFSQNAVK